MMLNFNYSAAVSDETLSSFNFVFIFVIAVNLVSIAYYIINVYIDFRVGKFDTNIIRIHHFIYITCPVSSIAIIIIRVLQLLEMPEGYDPGSDIFMFLNYLRTTTVFPGLICLACFVMERCCATWLIKDYESKDRSYIGYSIGLGLYFTSAMLAYTLQFAPTTFYHVLFMFGLNMISCLGNVINYKLNSRYFKEFQNRHCGEYSLAERFQISDNIHFTYFFNRFASSIAFFTLFCPLCVLIASFDILPVYRNITVVTFEAAYGIYTILTPYIIYKFNLRWQQEYQQFCKQIFGAIRRNPRVEVTESYADPNNVTLRDTFGHEMNIEICLQTETHFDQLQTLWNSEPLTRSTTFS